MKRSTPGVRTYVRSHRIAPPHSCAHSSSWTCVTPKILAAAHVRGIRAHHVKLLTNQGHQCSARRQGGKPIGKAARPRPIPLCIPMIDMIPGLRLDILTGERRCMEARTYGRLMRRIPVELARGFPFRSAWVVAYARRTCDSSATDALTRSNIAYRHGNIIRAWRLAGAEEER